MGSQDLDRVPGRICQQLETVEFLFSPEKQNEVKQTPHLLVCKGKHRDQSTDTPECSRKPQRPKIIPCK